MGKLSLFIIVSPKALMTELKEQLVRTILLATVEKSPDVLWDVLDCGQFDGKQQQQNESQLSTMPPKSTSSGPSSSQGPSWCVWQLCGDANRRSESLLWESPGLLSIHTARIYTVHIHIIFEVVKYTVYSV